MPTVGDTGGSVRIEGLRQAIKQLESLGADKAELVELNFHAAETLKAAVSPLVPVYRGNRGENKQLYQYKSGGALKASLRSSKAKGYAQVSMGNSRVVYANPIHWGWFEDKEWFIQKNIKPNKFLYRGLSKVLDKIMAEYDRDLQALFDKYGFGEN